MIRGRVIKWFFYLGTQLLALGFASRIAYAAPVSAIGIRFAAYAGLVTCALAFANLIGEWKGKRDASR